ncbi:MAG: hypothetical protein ACM3X3_07090 [Betaproteobacteria bacterium]
MKRETDSKLVPFRCPRCGRLVAWTLSGAKVFCPRCKVWFEAEDGRISRERRRTADVRATG